jgi:hypothetical protein
MAVEDEMVDGGAEGEVSESSGNESESPEELIILLYLYSVIMLMRSG